ncbi:hypothetical protein BC830DRAFT_681809 [Chytriomyces sp. MP71]|nr:hypothetical protein BC830DRAFT_681809 [Chytriomyces sp. MP71]
MQSAKNTLLNYDSVIDAATDTMTGELGVLCESARVRTIELIQARVYLSRMVAHAIMAEMPRALVTHFVMEALDGLLASVKTLDAYFGVCALVSAVLSEGAAMNVDMASEFVNALPGLCSASVLMCLADSIDNYEVFRVCADTSVDVIRCFPTLKGEFQKLMMANIANLPHSQRDRARMVLDKV